MVVGTAGDEGLLRVEMRAGPLGGKLRRDAQKSPPIHVGELGGFKGFVSVPCHPESGFPPVRVSLLWS